MVRVGSLVLVLMVLFSTMFALPVYAQVAVQPDDVIFEDWPDGWIWDVIGVSVGYVSNAMQSTQSRPIEDYVMLPDSLTTNKKYYTDSIKESVSYSAGGGGGAVAAR